MIIDYEKKYIFIGLPFSASSAISKELIEQYGGTPLYHKHANIPLLKKMNNINLADYYIFAVIRDPVDIVHSVYNKYLSNPYGTYTDSKYFLEKGGFVTIKSRKTYELVQNNKMSFKEYLLYAYKKHPYDNDLSINAKYITKTIDFYNLSKGFKKCLEEIGIEPVRELALYNKTNKTYLNKEIPENIIKKVFGPFYYTNRKYFFNNYNISILNKIFYTIYKRIRYYKRLKYDIRQMNSLFSIEDLQNER